MSKRSIRKTRHLNSKQDNINYNHKEAYCLMHYRCERCGKHELVWNSRDGVTPFSVGCNQDGCKGLMYHVNWHLDLCTPNYKLTKGQRYFKDMTVDDQKEAARRIISRAKGTEYEIKDEEEFIKSYVKNTHEGEPCVRVYQ